MSRASPFVKIRRYFFFSLLALLLFLMGTEIAARLIVKKPPVFLPDEMFWSLERHTNLFGQYDRLSSFDIEGRQVKREKTTGVFRVICLGSSSTYGAGVADRSLAFPGVLGRLLPKTEVINAGFGGYNSYQLFIYFSEVLSQLKPDAVVFYYGGNENYGFSAKTFYPRVKKIVADFRAAGVTDPRLLREAVQYGVSNRFSLEMYRLLNHSQAFLWWRSRVVQAEQARQMMHRPMVVNDPRRKIEPTFDQIIRSMAQQCRLWSGRLLLCPEIASTLNFADPDVPGTMFRLCAEGGAVCLDALHASPGLTDPALFLDSTHLNETGHERLAATLLPMVKALAEAR